MSARPPRTGLWMGGAFLGALLIALGTLLHFGHGSRGTYIGLQLTARWSYGFFWLAYTGGPLALLFGSRLQPLARRGRELGLAFASAHLIHAALVVWLYHISSRAPIPTSSAVFFGTALGFTYLLALLSIPTLARALPRWLWRAIVTVGMEVIALAFLSDFLRDPFGHGSFRVIRYVPFIVMALAAALLRLTAYGVKAYLSLSRRARPPGSHGAAPTP